MNPTARTSRLCAVCEQVFRQCLSKDDSDERTWYLGIKLQMKRFVFQRDLHLPGSMDTQEPEIFLHHIQALCEVYAKVNTKDSAMRKLALKTCWRAGGRAGEPGLISIASG